MGILFEIFAGEAGSTSSGSNKYVSASFSTMRLIVTVGWSIYPLGYFFGYLMGSVEDSTLNLVYNLADFVNKIAFCLAFWNSARSALWKKQVRPSSRSENHAESRWCLRLNLIGV